MMKVSVCARILRQLYGKYYEVGTTKARKRCKRIDLRKTGLDMHKNKQNHASELEYNVTLMEVNYNMI